MIVPLQAKPLVTNLLPEIVAKYFTRDVVDVELLAEDEVPEIEQRAEELRARTESGRVSKLASNLVFDVQETQI